MIITSKVVHDSGNPTNTRKKQPCDNRLPLVGVTVGLSQNTRVIVRLTRSTCEYE